MSRIATRVCAALAVLSSVQGAASQTASIAGRWSATQNWQTAGGLYMILSIAPNGTLQEHVQNRMGMAYDLTGDYRYDPASGTLQYRWTDYSPKQICMPVGCTPLQPPQQMNTVLTNRVQFLNADEFVGSTRDGSITWVRMQ